jgi:hypothetical protein
MGCLTGIVGIILPRFALLVGWYNDPNYWNSLLSSQVWLLGGFLFFPWTTLIYGFTAPNGMTVLNWIFVAFAVVADLGTWGIGAFAAREQRSSSYRGT